MFTEIFREKWLGKTGIEYEENKHILTDIKKINLATARGGDCEQAISYLNMEFEMLKMVSQLTLVNQSKVMKEKNELKRKVNEDQTSLNN